MTSFVFNSFLVMIRLIRSEVCDHEITYKSYSLLWLHTGFSLLGRVCTTSRKFSHPPHLAKISPPLAESPPAKFYPSPLTKQQFSNYKPIKILFLAVLIAPVLFSFDFILFGDTGHTKFDFNWCWVFTESCFLLWKRLESSKSLLLRLPPAVKKSPLW